MIEEYTVVRAVVAINDKVPIGSVGTVLIVHDDTNFEIEFMENGKSIDVLTVNVEMIEPVSTN